MDATGDSHGADCSRRALVAFLSPQPVAGCDQQAATRSRRAAEPVLPERLRPARGRRRRGRPSGMLRDLSIGRRALAARPARRHVPAGQALAGALRCRMGARREAQRHAAGPARPHHGQREVARPADRRGAGGSPGRWRRPPGQLQLPSSAITYSSYAAARLGRRLLRPHVRAAGGDGAARCSTGSTLQGDERVLDAGCGTGRVTAVLLDRAARAARSSPSTARRRWSRQTPQRLGDRVDVRRGRPAGARARARRSTRSSRTATFHWIADHDAAVRAPARRAASPAAGSWPSAAARATSPTSQEAIDAVGHPALAGWAGPWNFATPADTARAAARAPASRDVWTLAAALAGRARGPARRIARPPRSLGLAPRALPPEEDPRRAVLDAVPGRALLEPGCRRRDYRAG